MKLFNLSSGIFASLSITNLQLFFTSVVVVLLAHDTWKKRRLYYYAYKVPGSFSTSSLASVYEIIITHLLKGGSKEVYNIIYNIIKNNKGIKSPQKYWVGKKIFFLVDQPEDIEIVLKKCPEKNFLYNYSDEFLKDTLVSAPVDFWKKTRRIVIKPFSTDLIHSFVEMFAKYGNKLIREFDVCEGPIDTFREMWLSNIHMICETLANVDPNLIQGHEEYMESIYKGEEISVARMLNPLTYFDFVWKFWPLRKEALKHKERRDKYVKQILDIMEKPNSHDSLTNNWLQFLQEGYKRENLSHEQFLSQVNFIFYGASATTASTISYLLFLLGLHPHIQEKVFEELSAIFQNEDRDPNVEDLKRLEYLERVIKETMRLFPVIPFVQRYVDEDIQIGSCVLPAGSNVFVSIGNIHRNEKLWPDPLKFDPDRFLPEEVAKRLKCSYIPFSYGPRNCIGYRYAMTSMKVILSIVLRRFKVKSSNYKTIEEVDFNYHILANPRNGFLLELEKRAI